MEADALRATLAGPEQRRRAAAVLSAWEQDDAAQPEVETVPKAALMPLPRKRPPAFAADVSAPWSRPRHHHRAAIRSCCSRPPAPRSSPDRGPRLPRPRGLAPRPRRRRRAPVGNTIHGHPQAAAHRRARASRSRASAWLSSLRVGDAHGPFGCALYVWLWALSALGRNPYPVADILNCLTAFPLFWCFFVLDKPSVAAPGQPERNASFRRAVGVTWGIGGRGGATRCRRTDARLGVERVLPRRSSEFMTGSQSPSWSAGSTAIGSGSPVGCLRRFTATP